MPPVATVNDSQERQWDGDSDCQVRSSYVLRAQALRRGGCRARHPGNRPRAVPPYSRCRARQHHGQAVTLTPDAPIAVMMS